MSRKTISCYSQ